MWRCGTTRKSSGIPSYLAELKDHIKSIPWGKLYASESEVVLCLAWQDNNITLLLSTIHSAYHYVKAERKRPAATSTNTAIARAPFGDNFKEELGIAKVINNYNHYMGGVDIANQYQATCEIRLRTMRTWFPRFFFFLDAAIIKAYRIQCIAKKQQLVRPLRQLELRDELYQELFQFAAQTPPPPRERSPPIQQIEIRYNQRISLDRRSACVWC